jgi:hypothetical protein
VFYSSFIIESSSSLIVRADPISPLNSFLSNPILEANSHAGQSTSESKPRYSIRRRLEQEGEDEGGKEVKFGNEDEVGNDDSDESQVKDDGDTEFNKEESEFRHKDEPVNEERPSEIKAGAQRAKNQVKFIDRYSGERMKQLIQHNDQHGSRFIAKFFGGGKQPKGSEKIAIHHDIMTKKMKIHKPGTAEFEARQKQLLEHIQKYNKEHNIKRLFDVGKETPKPVLESLRKDSLPFRKEIPKQNLVKGAIAKVPILKHFARPSREEEMILDVSVSFYMHLETGIYGGIGGKLMTEDKIVALSDYLDLVSLSLPPEWHLHVLVDELRSRFEYVAEGYGNMMEVMRKYPIQPKMWSRDCTTDRGRFHVGFDCGFWKLLHTMTLGVAEQRGGMNLVESGMVNSDTKTFSPLEAADVIRNLMKYYYGKNGYSFVENYDDCKRHRRCDRLTDDKEGATIGDWKELALWLWEVHNEIAVKIVKEKKAEHRKMPEGTLIEEMEVIWPTIDQCFMCFDEDGTWNENEVFYFLEQNYW